MSEIKKENNSTSLGPHRGPMRGPGPMMGPGEKAKNVGATLLRIWSFMNTYKLKLAFVVLMVLLSSVFGLLGPWLISQALDSMTRPSSVDFSALLHICLLMGLLYFLSAGANWVQTWFMIRIAQSTIRDIRAKVFRHLQILHLRFFDRHTHGELMSRLSNDVETMNNTLTQTATQIVSSAVTLVGTLILMFSLSPLLACITLVTAPLGMLISKVIIKATRSQFSAQQKELGLINGYVEELISGSKVVKSFNRENQVINGFEAINHRLRTAGIKAQTLSGLMGPVMNVINNFAFALVAVCGGIMAINGQISLGLIAAFTIYARQISRPINEIANQFNMIQSALAGAERVFQVLDETPEYADQSQKDVLGDIKGDVQFESVDFSYIPGRPILKNINLKAQKGQTIALVGPTGAGKTTIINLLTRFYDIDAGSISIDGKDLRILDKDSLRSKLGLVLQDAYLFSASVKENLRYGRLDASDEEILEAARKANVDVFIERLPESYDTILGEDAGDLSQGQRQLLTIARAILANPSILILDEATSSVDTRTEVHIQQAMLKLMKGRTSFVIAHRLSTIRKADEILVIDKGEIVERGNHQALLDQQGFYWKLYNSQFKKKQNPLAQTSGDA